jgi:thioredoxin reductase
VGLPEPTGSSPLKSLYDVIIVGGGPAGLSAATILGRARRRVVIFDDGKYRNEASRGIHGFLSRDGIHPAELRRIAREQLARYEVEYLCHHINAARRIERGFAVTLDDGSEIESRTLLLATGVVDRLPPIEGVERFYGCGVFHCPYCDGWEVRGRPLAAYGPKAAGLAASLKSWSEDVVFCPGGPARLKAEEASRLDRLGIRVFRQKVARLEGAESLEQIVLIDGSTVPCRGLFFQTEQTQRCDLAASLGCHFTRKGVVKTGKLEGTNVPGLFVAGDASKDVQLAIVAAAEGAKAAIAINTALQLETSQ